MIRTYTMSGWSAVLAAAFAAAPAAADTPPEPKNDPVLPLIRDLQGSISRMQLQLDEIAKENVKSQKAIQDAAAVRLELDQLKGQIAQLQKRVDDVSRPPVTRVSGFNAPPAGPARIHLVNADPFERNVVVNGALYRLLPGEEKFLESREAGRFSFQVLGRDLEPQTREVGANETYLIRVYPR